MNVRTRIAPSPTGVPHIGNTRTALFDYVLAKKYDGKFILRIEDTDQKRLVQDSVEKIYQILDKLGLKPDEGPQNGGDFGPYVQTERLEIYKKYCDQLIEQGHAYRCFCTAEDKREANTKYDKRCLKLTPEQIEQNLKDDKPFTIRLNVPTEGKCEWNDMVQGRILIPYSEVDDKVLMKSNGIPTYHLAVVVDDHLMEISHIIRGVEWISSTPIHLLLFKAFGWEVPVIAHVPLLLGPDRSKLSKRHGAKNALEYMEEGYLPEALNNFMFYLGFSYQDNSALLTLEDMAKVFDEKKIQKQNAIFDIQKLNWLNKQWIKKLDNEVLAQKFLVQYQNTANWKSTYPAMSSEMAAIFAISKDRLTTLKDFFMFLDMFLDPKPATKDTLAESSNLSLDILKTNLELAHDSLKSIEDWHKASIETKLRADIEKKGLNTGEYLSSIRAAITRSRISPQLFDTLELVGREASLFRITESLSSLL
jgi:glutamyl-tRNA synthetase